MLAVHDLDRIAGAIRSAALDQSRWEMVLSAIQDALPGINAHLLGQCTRYGVPLFTMQVGYDPERIEAYEAHYGMMNPWAPIFSAAPAGTVLHARQMCAEEDLLDTEFYADWVLPQEDIRGGGGAILDKGPETTLLMGANIRLRDRDRFEGEWMQLCHWAMPRMRHAWEVNRRLASAALERSSAVTGHGSGSAIFVLRAGGRLGFANAQAETLIEAGDLVRVDVLGQIVWRAPGIATMVEGARSGGSGARIVAHRGRRYWAAVERLAPDDLAEWPLAVAFGLRADGLVVCLGEERRSEDAIERIAARLGLTAAEARVALHLAEGETPEEIASSRQVSLLTVREQIRSARGKLGLRRQLDLAVLVTRTLRSR